MTMVKPPLLRSFTARSGLNLRDAPSALGVRSRSAMPRLLTRAVPILVPLTKTRTRCPARERMCSTSIWISRCPGCCWYWAVLRAFG